MRVLLEVHRAIRKRHRYSGDNFQSDKWSLLPDSWDLQVFPPLIQRFVKLLIIVMIIGSVYRITRVIVQSLQSNFATAPQIKYEHFFKQIQKSSNPIEAIRIYDQYKEQSLKHDQFIAITLRILTRSMRIGQNDDPQAVKGFFERNLNRVKKINLRSLSVQYIKDIIIFYVNYFEHFALSQYQIQTLNLYLQQFLVRFRQTSKQSQIELYSIVIFLSIPLTHIYSPTYNQQYLKILLSLLQNNTSKYMIDHDDFEKILRIFSTFADLNTPIHKQITLLVFSKLNQLNIAQTFTQKRTTAILTCILHMKKAILNDPQCAQLIASVYLQAENALLKMFSTVKMYTFSRIIPTLLQLRPQSHILVSLYGIIRNSIVQQFQCKIDPRVVVMCISFLSRNQFYRYFSNEWAKTFVKMVHYYHIRNELFFDGIVQKLYTIINARILDYSSSFELYKVIFDKISQANNQQNRKIGKKLIMSAIMHAKHCRLVEAEHSLLRSNEYFRLDKKQVNNISFNSNLVDLFAFYNKVCAYQQNQTNILPGFPSREKVSLQQRKFKFVTDLLCLLFNLKIHLAYSNLQYTQVENTLKNSQIAQVKYIYNKEKVCKTVVFECKFSDIHFSNVVQLLLKLYGNSNYLQSNLSRFLKKRIQMHQQLSNETLGLIFFFYSKYHPQQFIKLIASQQYLLQSLLKARFSNTLKFILQSSKKHVLKRQTHLILPQLVQFCKQNLQVSAVLDMFRLISKYLPSLIELNEDNDQIFNVLKDCSFYHFIFEEETVVQTMQSLSEKSKGSKKHWFQIKLSFLRNLQPELKQLFQNRKNPKNTLAITATLFNKVYIQIGSLNNIGLLKSYLTLLQSWITVQAIPSVNDTIIRLKNIALKQDTQQSFKLAFFRFAINKRIFFSEFDKTLFDKYTILSLPNQSYYFSQLCYFPILKEESVLYSFIQQVALNPTENMVPFCLNYSLVENPSLQLRQFMTKLCIRYKKNVPSFFKVYLSEMDSEAFSLIKVKQMREQMNLFPITQKEKNILQVLEKNIKDLFENDKILTSNWWGISKKTEQGVHLLIAHKILQKKFPNKYSQFPLKKNSSIQNNG